MDILISTELPSRIPGDKLESMFRLRREVFHDRLGWAVQTRNGMERDHFDDLPNVTYMIGAGGAERRSLVGGCCRQPAHIC